MSISPRRGKGLGCLEDMSPSLGGARGGCTLNCLPPAFAIEPEMPCVELNYNEALQYLRREAVRVPAPRGMVLLCYKGYVLGLGKCVGNRINNLYPEQWRIRTTYTTPFSLLGIE